MRITPTLTRLAACCLVAAPVSAQSQQMVQVIDRITVVDGTGRAPIPDAVVVIADGRIQAVGPRGQVAVPAGAERIDGRGGFLLPGFIEMHAHVTLGPVELDRSGPTPSMKAVTDPRGARPHLAQLLASGITTMRDPGGPATQTVAVRDSVARGQMLGPRMFVAGEVIDKMPFPGLSATVATPEDVRREVRRQAAAGVDMVKLYAWLTPDLVAVGVEEAHRVGLPAIAHVMFTTWTEAARLGVDGIVHIPGWSPDLLPAAARPKYAQMLAGGTQFLFGWFELVDLESPEMAEAIDALAARRVHLDPTLVVFERAVRGDDALVTASPALRDASPALVANWRSFFTFSAGWSADDFARARAAWPKALRLTRILHERGVLLTAGTDANNPWTVPGESYHRELELLVEAGIAPLDVISIATRNGAKALEILDETGTVETGKRADLVLLVGDPTKNISAVRQVELVMKAGVVHRPDEVLRSAGLRP